MRLKIYRAPTVAAAMAQVRTELGADALILSTRRAGGAVELTAALEPPAPSLPNPALPDPTQPDPALLNRLRWHGIPAPLATDLAATYPPGASTHAPLEHALAARLRFAPLDLSANAPPLLLAGPPGAGKSLTVARLATRLVMAGTNPLIISADGDRAGAAEQLAAFTRLLGLVLIVAPDPLTLARALARRNDGAPVLIDAPGIDPFAPAAQAGMATLAATVGATTALVLPAGMDASEAADTASAFRAAGATHLVATRIDLARRLGGVLAAAAAGLALAEAGIGPGAADGLHPMTPHLLAKRLLTERLVGEPHRKAA